MRTSDVCPTPKAKRKVRFDGITDVETVLAPRPPERLGTEAVPSQIQDLPDALQRKHGVFLLGPLSCQEDYAVHSLRDILASHAGVGPHLTLNRKFRIAADLASSVLQLYNTPWLEEQWDEGDILFIRRPGTNGASTYEHPFVCRNLTSATVERCTGRGQMAGKVIRNQTLFALGILLIELWYSKSIEELLKPEDLDCRQTPGIVWCTAAIRLVEDDEFEDNAGVLYVEAVRRCIRCDSDQKDMGLENESFQQAVYYGVVVLLEENLHRFTFRDYLHSGLDSRETGKYDQRVE